MINSTRRLNRILKNAAITGSVVIGGMCLSVSPIVGAEPSSEAELYFELNATDRDVGLHGFFDAASWEAIRISRSDGDFDAITVQSNSGSSDFGLTELFFESNEPPIDNRSFADLLKIFPAGPYEIEIETNADEKLRIATELTSNLPCPPFMVLPTNVDGDDLVIKWRLQPGVYDPDTDVCSQDRPLTVKSVLVVVELSDSKTGKSRSATAELAPGATSFRVPSEFLADIGSANINAKAELQVIEETGNRTSIEKGIEL